MKDAQEKTYRIYSADSGQDLGTYNGESEEAAAEAMARDAGYKSREAMSAEVGGELEIVETDGTEERAV